jgi:hypothetical protein
VDQKFFYQGETLERFVESLKDNRAKFEQMLADSEPGEMPASLGAGFSAVRYVLVIAEPWSGDVLYFLPPLLRLAELAKWEVRIFPRDQYPDLILPYRKDGLYHAIPVFVFYDHEFNELAHWVERPALATRTIDEESLKLRRRLREEHKDEWRKETVQEIKNLFRSQD